MSGISQTIPSYHGGISEQPDYLKNPGQVRDAINVVPDITYGLYKRLGAKRLGTNALTPSTNDSKWFSYTRNIEEGCYVGQIDNTGAVKMWRTQDFTDGGTTYTAGSEVPVVYGTGGETAIKNYLKNPSGTSNQLKNIHTLTINDTTFVNNRKIETGMLDSFIASAPHSHYAYVELKKTENGRQYGLDIGNSSSSNQSYWTATRLRVERTGPSTAGAGEPSQGHCPHIGTRVSEVSTGTGSQLIFRLTVTGQQTISTSGGAVSDRDDYSCQYTLKIDLLHGGKGWASSGTNPDSQATSYTGYVLKGATYTIHIEDAEKYEAKAFSGGLIRPMPTPFDAETAASAGSILGGLKSEINGASLGVTAEIIGNGIYLYSSNPFNVNILENDLMRVITDSTSDVSNLPNQCKNGYIVKVSNSQKSEEDDYFLKFEGYNGADGAGKWVETVKPGIRYKIDPATMPHTIQRTGANQFTVAQFEWADREVGDNVTNPKPTFMTTTASGSRYIHKMLFFRNRLVLTSGSNIILSAPNDLGNFWRQTALTVGPNDGIDISTSQEFPSNINNGIELNAGLVFFSQNQQFLLDTYDAATLTPDSAKTTALSTYYNNKLVEPISLGTTLGFIDNSGRNSRFMEMANIQSGQEPSVYEHSKVVPRLLPKDVNLFDVSRDNGIIFVGKIGTDTIYGYRWYGIGEQRLLSGWFKWKLAKSVKYFFVSDDSLFIIDDNNFLQRINLIASDEDLSAVQDSETWNLHVDNWTSITGGSYSTATDKTTFTGVSWLSSISGVTAQLVLIKDDSSFVKCSVSGTTITVDGDWSSGNRYLGYLYDMQVDFPTFYPNKTEGQKVKADVNGSLVLHRLKVAFGRVGTYETTLTRTGKSNYTHLYESTNANDYEAGDVPYLLEDISTIPVYEKNSNLRLTLKSTYPSPATLRSMSWEGDYTEKNYKRV